MGALSRLDAAAKAKIPAVRPATPQPAAGVVPLKQQIDKIVQTSHEKRAPQNYAEIRRICGLPVVHPLTPEELDAFCRAELLAEAYDSGFRLHEPQANALISWDQFPGLFCPIGVGFGKSLLSYMLAQRAFVGGGRPPIKRILLIVPAQVYETGFVIKDPPCELAISRGRVPINVPFHLMGGGIQKRAMLAATGWEGCYVVKYSQLSTRDTSDLLEAIKPGLIIADEAHNLARMTAACTKRLFGKDGYITKHRPRFIAMSGTITDKKVKQYWHLMMAALGENCPLPLSSQLADEWGSVIDSGAQPSDAQTGPIRPLVEFAREHDRAVYENCAKCKGDGYGRINSKVVCDYCNDERYKANVSGFRSAYRFRMTTAPGVISTGTAEIGTSLILHNEVAVQTKDDPGYKTMLDHIRRIDDEMLTPNGDEIDHAIHKYKWKYELSAGFYNELFWQPVEDLAIKKSCSLAQAEELLEHAREHHVRANEYASLLRRWLEGTLEDQANFCRAGLDTPMLVAGDMTRNKARNVDDRVYEAWALMHSLDFEGRPERLSRGVRVCDYKVRHAIRWAKELPHGTGGIVWFYHNEFGQWIAEQFVNEGFEINYCPAGDAGNKAIVDPKNKHKISIASVSAHGTGKNLQYNFQHQMFVQWPRSAKLAEQALGRTHRTGQMADELVVERVDSLPFDRENFAACLNDAVYIHQSTGQRQKLVYAMYEPQPVIFPSEWLAERGFQNKILSVEQRKILSDRFGKSAVK